MVDVANKVVIVYKNIIAIVPDAQNVLLVLGAFRHAVGNSILMNNSLMFMRLLRNQIPEENFFFNIPFTNKYINSEYTVFEHNASYQGLCKVDQITSVPKQYMSYDFFSSRIGTYFIEKIYRLAKHDICIPDVFSNEELSKYYNDIEFAKTEYGEIPILEKSSTILKEVDSGDGILRRLQVAPEYPNIIINRIMLSGTDLISSDITNNMLFNYAYVFKYVIMSRVNTDNTLTGYLLFRDSISFKDLVHLDVSGFNCNLNNIDILYMLATIIIPNRSLVTPYLKIGDNGTMYWTDDPTGAFISHMKVNLNNFDFDSLTNIINSEFGQDANKKERGFWTKNRNIF